MEIIHMMAEQTETTVQGSGGAYEIHSAGNTSRPVGDGIGLPKCSLPYAGVCTGKAMPVYRFLWCYIQLHICAPVGTHRNVHLPYGCVSTRLY